MAPYSPRTIAGIHQPLDRAPEAELDLLALANRAHQEDRYIACVRPVSGILRQLAYEAEAVG